MSVCSGEDVSDTTRIPEGWADGELGEASRPGRPPAWSMPAVDDRPHAVDAERRRDVAGDGVGIEEQDALRAPATWSTEARLVAIVVLPTPPFGLKTTMTVARRAQQSDSTGPPWRIGPEPSSTVWLRMHIASTRQRSDSAEYGRVKYSSSTLLPSDWRQPIERPGRDDHQGRDRPAGVAEQAVVLERLVEVGLAVEDRDGDVAAAREQRLELVGVLDRDRP